MMFQKDFETNDYGELDKTQFTEISKAFTESGQPHYINSM